MNWKKIAIWIGIIGAVQFLLMSGIAMKLYPGGTIVDRGTEGYSFFSNFFSDLGRTRAWNGTPNSASNLFYTPGLAIAGVCLALFFIVLPAFFKNENARPFGLLASGLGVFAALCYLGIARFPLDVNYSLHTLFVRAGFIAFLFMCFGFAAAIFREPSYPDHFGRVQIVFAVILTVQVIIMLFGPRSWTSSSALALQATAQKVVVYAEMGCMLYQCAGALKVYDGQ